MPHGTAYSHGQYNEVLTAILRALPGALEDDPKHLLRVLQAEGERFGQKLRGTFAELLEEFPFSYYEARDRGLKLIKDVPPLENKADYLHLQLVDICPELTSGEDVPNRAWEMGTTLGQKDAEWLVKNAKNFLKSACALGDYNYIFFPGTVWCGEDSFLRIPHIHVPRGADTFQIGFDALVGQMRGYVAFRKCSS